MDDRYTAGGDAPSMTPFAMLLPTSRTERLGFIVRAALTVAAVFVGLYILWLVRDAFLLLFLSIVLGTVLIAAIEPVRRWTHLSHRWSLTVVGISLFVLVVAAVWLIGSQVSGQIAILDERLPQSVRSIEQSLGISLSAIGEAAEQAQAGGGLFSSILSVGKTVIGVLAAAVIAIIGAFFLAAAPERYVSGVVKLFPKQHHDSIDSALRASGNALKLWLLAQLISMIIVGVLVWIGTWMLGLPASLALGIFAALTEFIPYLGPWIGAAPAVLLSFSQDGGTVLWTVLLFVAIQQIESNLITPLVQQGMVEIPAALILFAVVAVGLLFGVLGLIVAAPLTVVLYVLVKKLYVRQTLGEPTEVPGER